ncbi:MAG: trypsin-like peptidase domain-containing protein [Nitriliruptorales bacterium]|nr:trypsin-like peptidase domain-containing protein [Nitriliruptorales bacterium]
MDAETTPGSSDPANVATTGPADPEPWPRAAAQLPPPAGPPTDPWRWEQPRSTPPREPSRGGGRTVAVALAAALIGGVVGTTGTLLVRGEEEPPVVNGGTVQAPVIEGLDVGEANAVSVVAAAVTPSVASVETFSGTGLGAQSLGLGSAVIYRSDGYLLTNHHVVEDASRFDVRLADGDIQNAELIGSDPLTDIAVLKINATGLPAINIRTEPPVAVGETAIAIGSPFGLHTSVTAGVVSALNREIQVDQQDGAALVIPSVIQTDAAINPGNSGGALVDAQGRLIGINTAILTDTGGNQGVGFAIPVSQAVIVADQLIEQGFVRHPFLGITGVDVTPRVAEEFGFSVDKGAQVDTVQPDSAAEQAGLRSNDIIVRLDDLAIDSMSDLVAALRSYAPGDTVVLGVVRGEERLDITVVLGER